MIDAHLDQKLAADILRLLRANNVIAAVIWLTATSGQVLIPVWSVKLHAVAAYVAAQPADD